MQTVYVIYKQKSRPKKVAKVQIKNPKKWQNQGKNNPKNPALHVN